jgi:FKBP-type peptidyl-prolyl cis-trans isomerase
MRIVKFVAVAAFGLIALAACHKKPATHDHAAAPAKTYTLSAADNTRFLADYAARSGVHKTADGLMYRVVKAGNGPTAQSPQDIATVTYKGSTIDGKIFDQTEPGQPRSFPVGRLIPGWVEALSMMKEGDDWELAIPASLGYGAQGAGDAIPPNQTLVFEMHLLKVQPAQ